MVRQIAAYKLSGLSPFNVASSLCAADCGSASCGGGCSPTNIGRGGRLELQSSFETADTRSITNRSCSSLARDYLLLADTNHHKVKVFGTDGVLKLSFGGAGGLPGQLLYPVAVAFCPSTSRIVVAERAPAHQLQFFDVYGTFINRCGGDVLTHPRAIAVDEDGCVAVVESRVMRVYIFAASGIVRFNFSNAKWIFPTDIAVNNQRVYVCDNRSHCVWVHTYEGHAVRRVGDASSITFPVAVSIVAEGNILVTSNHTRLTIAEFNDGGTENSAHCCSVSQVGINGIAVLNNNFIALVTSDLVVFLFRVEIGATV